jgi:hypothetical protein
MLLALLLAASFDADLALQHAARLSALGPHPWGSPRARIAAEYVASQFRAVGLEEVRLQEFESHGIQGANVLGVARAAGDEVIVIGAHHDTAPGAPGAYDDGGGVGVLIEVARAALARSSRPRTLVFASWDGEEAWHTGRTTTAGSRADVRSLGPRARRVVAALAIEMCGFERGAPVLHPIAYEDPKRPGGHTVAPGWLVKAALAGARQRGATLGVGDPLIPWLYQPAVRTFRVRLYGDDLSFLQAGLPAVFVSDSSFTTFYPWYHQASDTVDKLDVVALGRMGEAVLGVLTALEDVPLGGGKEPVWFSAFGTVVGRWALLGLGALAVIPGLVIVRSQGGLPFAARLGQAALFGVLLWRHPVPALWVFLLPSWLTLGVRSWWKSALGLLPALALVGLGAAAWWRGFASGLWLAPWELIIAGLAFALLWLRPPQPKPRAKAKRKRAQRR